jgi:hypothetical protein
MKRLLLLTVIFLSACGPSPEESAKIATLSCNVMGASRNMDSSLRLVEINRARDELGKSEFLQTDDAIKEAFEYGLCYSLVLDSPNYSSLLSEAKAERTEQERLAKAERTEQERLAKEAEKARYRAKVLREKESTLKWRESVDRYFSEFATFRPKLLSTDMYTVGYPGNIESYHVKLFIGLTCGVTSNASETAGHHFGVDNIFEGLKVSADIHFKDGTVISVEPRSAPFCDENKKSVQPFSKASMKLEQSEWPDIIMDLAEKGERVSLDTLIEKIDLSILDVQVHDKVDWSAVTKADPNFSRSQAREFAKKLERTNTDIYGSDYEVSYDWKMDNPYIWPLELQKTMTATLVKTDQYGSMCLYDTPAGPVRLRGSDEGFRHGNMIEDCKKTFEILVE